jgi:hypothetical protein
VLYKYRGIKEMRYFVDIILNQRLYAAPYLDLNDPMEGHYLYSRGELDSDVRELIRGQKEKLRICSLSKVNDNELMWAHYSEGHRGVAIGLEIDEIKHYVEPIEYDGFPQVDRLNIHNLTAIEILTHKLEVWSYEEEVRAFTSGKMHVDVKVVEVLLGRSMANQDKSFITKLVGSINRNIEVYNAPKSTYKKW